MPIVDRNDESIFRYEVTRAKHDRKYRRIEHSYGCFSTLEEAEEVLDRAKRKFRRKIAPNDDFENLKYWSFHLYHHSPQTKNYTQYKRWVIRMIRRGWELSPEIKGDHQSFMNAKARFAEYLDVPQK